MADESEHTPRGKGLQRALDEAAEGSPAWRRARLLGLRAALQANRPLSEEQQLLAVEEGIRWLRETWGQRLCPYCENNRWEIGPPFDLPLPPRTGRASSPHFSVVCTRCGNTVLVDAERAGIAEEPEDVP